MDGREEMKKLLITLALLLITSFAYAGDYENLIDKVEKESFVIVSLKPYYFIPFDSEGELQPSVGVQLDLTHRSGAFAFLSYEKDEFRLAGQGGLDIELLGLGLGYKHKFDNCFSVFLDAGWYEPIFNDGWITHMESPFAEGLWHKMSHEIWYYHWDYYKYELKGGVGGKVGVEFKKHIKGRVFFEASAAVRFLKLPQTFISTDKGLGGPGWVLHDNKDYGGFLLSAGITF